MTLARPRIGLIPFVYPVIGIVIANSHHYLTSVDTIHTVGSAILAVVLWPLLLLGIDLHIRKVVAGALAVGTSACNPGPVSFRRRGNGRA